MLPPRHPRAKASPLSLEARAQRASKDERPGQWPSILRDARSALLRMTENKYAVTFAIGDKLSLIASRFTSRPSAMAIEFERRFVTS